MAPGLGRPGYGGRWPVRDSSVCLHSGITIFGWDQNSGAAYVSYLCALDLDPHIYVIGKDNLLGIKILFDANTICPRGSMFW